MNVSENKENHALELINKKFNQFGIFRRFLGFQVLFLDTFFEGEET